MTETLLSGPFPSGVAALAHWGVIRARGADAADFLQNQLTADVASLDASSARLAGWCSAKGRLLASFVVWRPAADLLLLACSADLLAATLKRLRMFVLRSKCELSDATAEVALHGVACADAATAVAALGEEAAQAGVWRRVDLGGGASAVRLPSAVGGACWLHVAPVGQAASSDLAAATQGMAAMAAAAMDGSIGLPPDPWSLPPLPNAAWRRLEVASGVARIEAATVDRFVPQMLNYELLGGVDFRKGCYPGQEVVARSQYRGTLKRRSLLFGTDGEGFAGQEVFHSADPGQPAGQVVNAAGGLALVEVKIAALGAGTLYLGAPEGRTLRPVAMPYEVPLHAVDPV